MNLNLDTGQWVVIGLSAFLLVWYFFASIYNRQRGLTAYRWLRRGLEQVGEISEAQWMGSSGTGARLVVAHPGKPYRKVESLYKLETREIFPYWILTHLQGRRDEIVIYVALRKPPDERLENNMAAFQSDYEGVIRRFAIGESVPHLTIWVNLTPALDLPAAEFFTKLRDDLQSQQAQPA